MMGVGVTDASTDSSASASNATFEVDATIGRSSAVDRALRLLFGLDCFLSRRLIVSAYVIPFD